MKKIGLVFAVLFISIFMVGCKSPTSPSHSIPQDRNIQVDYIRQPPVDYSVGDVVILRWSYPNYQEGVAAMYRIFEDNFTCRIQIKTETKITMKVEDIRKFY